MGFFFFQFLMVAAQAQAGAMDSLFQKGNPDQIHQVVMDLKDVRPPMERVLNRQGLQWAMIRNAEESQAGLLRELSRWSAHESGRVHLRRYWIVNAVAVSAPLSVLRELARNPSVLSMRPLGKAVLIQPVASHPVFTEGSVTPSLARMGVDELRKREPTLDGRGVRVGILDTGIDESHPDLRGKVVAFGDFSEKESGPFDDHGHGTHVAGSIAGGSASGAFIGVAPGAQLVVGKIFDSWGSADEIHLLDGMQWIADPDGNPATDDAPHVVNNSWGSDVPNGDPAKHTLCRLVDSWVKLGIVPVFAAGNHGPRAPSVSVPAACPSALAVGATDLKDVVAPFSSRGPVVWATGTFLKPEVSAPGVSVLSAGLNGRYVTMSGTSMSSPHVAGVLALMKQRQPQWGPAELVRALRIGTVDLGSPGPDPIYGSGRVDAVRAIEALSFTRF